jgi:hypothetical protein
MGVKKDALPSTVALPMGDQASERVHANIID